MSYEVLVELIVLEKYADARSLYMDLVRVNYFWNNAFRTERLRLIEPFYYPYKQAILNYSFALFIHKVQTKKLDKHTAEDRCAGIIVNTIREATHVYSKEIKPPKLEMLSMDVMLMQQTLKVEFNSYVAQVNPFDQIIKAETVKQVLDCLNEMKEPCKSLILYKHLYELSHKEIVEMNTLGLKTINSAQVTLTGCMKKLSHLLKKRQVNNEL